MDDKLKAGFWRIDEAECAANAIEAMRMESLANSIDSLEDRLMDCEQLIVEGKIDYEYAFKTMIKPQVERIVEAKNRVLDKSGLPSPISA